MFARTSSLFLVGQLFHNCFFSAVAKSKKRCNIDPTSSFLFILCAAEKGMELQYRQFSKEKAR